MATFKQTVDCTSCGRKNTVSVITKQTQYSRSIKVTKCKICNTQMGVKSTLDNIQNGS